MGLRHIIVGKRTGKAWGMDVRINRSKAAYLMDRFNEKIILSKLMQNNILWNLLFIHDKIMLPAKYVQK